MSYKFEVQIFYSGFCTYIVEAENKTEAIEKARLLEINKNELLSNLENWKEADTTEEIKEIEKWKKQKLTSLLIM